MPLRWPRFSHSLITFALGPVSITHSTETVLWAAKNEKSKHTFNYQEMRKVTGKQMKTVWTMTAPGNSLNL